MLYRLLSMPVRDDFAVARIALSNNNRNAEQSRPHKLILILATVQAMAQPDAPDDVAILEQVTSQRKLPQINRSASPNGIKTYSSKPSP